MKTLVVIVGCGVLGYVRGQINEATEIQNTLNIFAFVPVLVLAFWTMRDLRKQALTITVCATLINFLCAWLVQQPEVGLTLAVGIITVFGFRAGKSLVERKIMFSMIFIVPLLAAFAIIYPFEPRAVQLGLYFFVFTLATWLMEDEENDPIVLVIKHLWRVVKAKAGFILCGLALILFLGTANMVMTVMNARSEYQEMTRTRQTYTMTDGWVADLWGDQIPNSNLAFEPSDWTKSQLDLTKEGTFIKDGDTIIAVLDFKKKAIRIDADELLQKDNMIFWRNRQGTFALQIATPNEMWTAKR